MSRFWVSYWVKIKNKRIYKSSRLNKIVLKARVTPICLAGLISWYKRNIPRNTHTSIRGLSWKSPNNISENIFCLKLCDISPFQTIDATEREIRVIDILSFIYNAGIATSHSIFIHWRFIVTVCWYLLKKDFRTFFFKKLGFPRPLSVNALPCTNVSFLPSHLFLVVWKVNYFSLLLGVSKWCVFK